MRMIRYSLFTAFIAVFIFVANAAAYESEAAKSIDDEIQKRDRIVTEYIANNPNAVLEIPFTEAEMKEAEVLKDARISELNNISSMGTLSPLQVQINGSLVNVPPHMSVYMSIIEGQAMVPLSWMAGQLGATSVEWDAATRTATITTPQDFYSMEKFSSFATALRSDIDEYNEQIWSLPDKGRDLQLPDLVPDRHFALELEQFKPASEGLILPAPRPYITIAITSPDGIYEHSMVAHSIENHQDHYYLPMDWLEWLFNAQVSYNEATNILSIQTPDLEQIKSEIERIETALIPNSAEEAIKLWGRGMQTRNGALQYAALSPQLRQEANKSACVRQSFWVTGVSSPQVGPITITNQNELSETEVEYTISFPEIMSGQTYAIATEKMVVEKLSDNGREGWFITQILQASGYGIIDHETTSEEVLSFIKAYEGQTRMLTFDEIEWVMQEDTKRIDELGLDANSDFPNGFYIYNKSDQTNSLKIAENAKVYLVNWHDLSNHTLTDVNGLAERMAEYQAPYHLTIEDGVIAEILEQYTP